jgi:hypothetical protein
MTDTEIYYPQVYCEKCEHYIKIHGRDWCDIEEKWDGDFTFFPEHKNADHDCKDYEARDDKL